MFSDPNVMSLVIVFIIIILIILISRYIYVKNKESLELEEIEQLLKKAHTSWKVKSYEESLSDDERLLEEISKNYDPGLDHEDLEYERLLIEYFRMTNDDASLLKFVKSKWVSDSGDYLKYLRSKSFAYLDNVPNLKLRKQINDILESSAQMLLEGSLNQRKRDMLKTSLLECTKLVMSNGSEADKFYYFHNLEKVMLSFKFTTMPSKALYIKVFKAWKGYLESSKINYKDQI